MSASASPALLAVRQATATLAASHLLIVGVFRVTGLGFRVTGLGLRVEGLELRVEGCVASAHR